MTPEPYATYSPAEDRYSRMPYRRAARTGLALPRISLGLWHNFGVADPFSTQRSIVRRAFDLGVTCFDLANNYGPPPGAAERSFGRVLATDLRSYRDEIVIATKAGWDMWPGPYGRGSSRKHLLGSLDQSLQRLGVDYVDIFYSHRFDPETPLEETMGALATALATGKARAVGISSYSATRTSQALETAARLGCPLIAHQPSYSMLNRWVEDELLPLAERQGLAVVAFSPLAQGMLTDKYLDRIPPASRAARNTTLTAPMLSRENLERIAALNGIARRRGQSLAQMAIAWVLRQSAVTTVLIGASSTEQLDENIRALDGPAFDAVELGEIDRYARDGGINRWRASSEA